ncbi:hypothetical protein [Tepidibacillus sp. LV47]|uniref:hypothetical protein n=1 Tax=Tepidibacillus sp. LV47 TaxID=3398228 RepID=UPI003AAE490D
MLSLVLWIICLYGIVLLGFRFLYSHFCMKLAKEIEKENLHYLILAKDNQSIIEWVIRSLWFNECTDGKPIKITIMDFGSSDDTLEIIHRLTYKSFQVRVIQVKEMTEMEMNIGRIVEEIRGNGEQVQIIDLMDYDKRSKQGEIQRFEYAGRFIRGGKRD